MKKIFIPYNKTNKIDAALKFGALLDKDYPMEYIVLYEKMDDQEIQEHFNAVVAQYTPTLQNNSSVFKFIKTEGISNELMGIAAKYKNDITIGSYKNGLIDEQAEAMAFSDALKVIKQTKHNFIAIPDGQEIKQIKKIVFPINAISKVRHKVTITSQLAHLTGAEIHLITTHTTSDSSIVNRCNLYARQILGHFESLKLKTVPLTLHGKDISDLTLEYTEEVGADLIVIIPETITGIRLFSQGYLNAMLKKSKSPVLVVAPRRSKISGSFSSSG